MSWTYKQSTGEMISPVGVVANGYSGRGEGKNNPKMQAMKKTGPVPRGTYTIGPPYEDPHKGPCVMRLTPDPSDEMFGRSGFLIHGDNSKHDASEGCIILGPLTRLAVAASANKILNVIE